MTERTITIAGREVRLKSSAAVPRLYRLRFGRDIFRDLGRLEKSFKSKEQDGEDLQIEDLEVFENVAYVMARHADPGVPDTIEDWLDQFEMFSIYEVLPQILEMWAVNAETGVEAKKNSRPVNGN